MENQKNVINIMVATDNHLGYLEKDEIRGNDSFVAFEEILKLAKENNVDFILFGGDLFHDAKPSNNTLFKCLKLLRKYTLGESKTSLIFEDATNEALQNALNQSVNIEDPTIKVSIPVFSISGNHDQGFEDKNPLDLLAITSLVNYFGCWTNQSAIDVKPIVLRKGETRLALYGLSHMADSKLNNMFKNNNVNIKPQDPKTGEWFNIMVLHQNRYNRNPKMNLRSSLGQDYIPEEVFPDFIDLVVWAHEHVCCIKPEGVEGRRYKITQPGSSVMTRLSEGESMTKKVALLQVCGKEFQIIPLRLQTVRPYIHDCLNLTKVEEVEDVQELVKKKIETMIASAKKRLTGHPEQPTLPLLRLKIKHNNESQVFNRIRFGQQYNQEIANPSDLISFVKTKKKYKTLKNDVSDGSDNGSDGGSDRDEEVEDDMTMENYISQYFEKKQVELKSFTIEDLNVMRKRILDDTEVQNNLDSHQEEAVKRLMSQTDECNSGQKNKS